LQQQQQQQQAKKIQIQKIQTKKKKKKPKKKDLFLHRRFLVLFAAPVPFHFLPDGDGHEEDLRLQEEEEGKDAPCHSGRSHRKGESSRGRVLLHCLLLASIEIKRRLQSFSRPLRVVEIKQKCWRYPAGIAYLSLHYSSDCISECLVPS
jgi:hypothetical protein